MNFDDIKRINKSKQIDWFKRHKPKLIINLAASPFTLAQSSSNTRYIYDDNKKLIVGPIYINDYGLINKRAIYSKTKVSISFSEMDHYI